MLTVIAERQLNEEAGGERKHSGRVAQLAELPAYIRTVGGSSPSLPTITLERDMEALTAVDLAVIYCKAVGKYMLYINFMYPDIDDMDPSHELHELHHACPLLVDANMQVYVDGEAYFEFDTKEEVEKAFDLCVGDDGPTKTNPYRGPVRVYALTIGPNGTLDENT